MSWQKCPVCDGAGSVGVGYPIGSPCTVCGGHKIIDTVSGLPPRTITTNSSGPILIVDEAQTWPGATKLKP